MSAAVPLAGRIAKNRQLKLLAAQSRHLTSRFGDIFGDARVRTSRRNDRHFEGTVCYPLSGSCTLRLASEMAGSAAEAAERVRGAALALFSSKADLRHMLQAVDSDVFVELNATLRSMDAKAVIHLARVNDRAADQFVVTVTAELPLNDEDAATEVGARRSHEYDIVSDIAIGRGSGRCPRDAMKRGFAASLAELDDHAVAEHRGREEEAWRYLQSVQRDELQHDWESVGLSAFLANSLNVAGSGAVKWLPLPGETETVRVAVLSRIKSQSLTLTAGDAAGNATLLTLPLPSPPLAFQRVLVGDDEGSARLLYASALAWPARWVVSSVLMQLCTVLNAGVRGAEVLPCGLRGATLTSQETSFLSLRSFVEAHGTLPVRPVPYSLERCLFVVNTRLAACFASQNEGVQLGGSGMPRICLGVAPTEAKPLGQGPRLRLEVKPTEGGADTQAYRTFVAAVLRAANAATRRGRPAAKLHPAPAVNAGLLGRLWGLLATMEALAGTQRAACMREISLWSPAEMPFSAHERQSRQQLLGFVAQLFAADAQVVEAASGAGSLPNVLTLSSPSLEVQSLPLCHVLEAPDVTCRGLLHDVAPDVAEVGYAARDIDPRRTVEAATEQRELQQASYYCPDLLLMIQEIRLELRLSQRSFPTLEFFQKAVHDVPQRVQELAMGVYGDVPVYTRVVAHWGPNLRVEVESDMQSVTDNNGVYCFLSPQHNHSGPLRLLLSVVCAMYGRVFPHRTTFPLIALNSPTRRRSIDFLLYSWFMASPQIRCFEIGTRTARLTAATAAMARQRSDAAELALSGSVSNYIIRAMLFYDFCGQRVLFAETHAATLWRAVRHVNELAVSLNVPEQDAFPPPVRLQRDSRGFNITPGGFDSEAGLLLRALVGATRSNARVCFVRTNDAAATWLEGTVEVQVPLRQIRCAASVTRARGVIPTLVAACHEALRVAAGEEAAGAALRSAQDAGPLIPRDNFPHFSARFYTPVNLLGEVLQGVAGKYHCTYTIDSHTREVVCLLHVAALAGYGNAAPERVPFPLGLGRGRNKRIAWATAAAQALRTNFPSVLQQVERHKQLCELLHRPDDLWRLGCCEGFTFAVARNMDALSGGGGYKCTVVPQNPFQLQEVNATAATSDADPPKVLLEHCADRGVDAYLTAADALLDRLRQQRQDPTSVAVADDAFTLWDPTANYGKSAWHACCGALGVAFDGRVSLRFEGGRGDAWDRESEAPLRVQLVVRTWSPADKRVLETPLHTLHERRIIEYSCLAGLNEEGGPSAEHLLFASTRLLAEATSKYADEHTRKSLGRLLRLLRRLREEEQCCVRLSAKRRLESCAELTLGCQCRVVVRQLACGMVAAELGMWLPGQSRTSRVPVVLSACKEPTTTKALKRLEDKVRRVVDSLWATMLRPCAR
ncbi:uncharacterized protein Tco025E_04098 [Trypanosoma conorhini]|uniref:Uncharacterized protein n=1 Tax=Trypanosoma conorhini TaxID=83891 RepID=A0A3R7S243_9TRYP|nr:uncharacterized protein Tco025E_04098 [Trypanosoma conorhini]RNF19564.1 hypothetical protein Tco025E_04098 [Trypanosoma conorhini]